VKTFTLWMVLVVGLGLAGSYLAAWYTPTILAVAREGWSGIDKIRVSNHTPQPPEWVGEPGTVTRGLGAIAFGISLFGGTAAFGLLGERLYQHVVVRLGWLTEDEVDEARRNEKQYF
jgi:hypothetical protein